MKKRVSILSTMAVIICVSIAFVILTVLNQAQGPASAAALFPAPSPQSLGLALYRAGLDPKSLAAAGVASNTVSTIVANGRQYLTAHPTDLQQADSACAESENEIESLRKKIQAGQGTQGNIEALATAQTQCSLAQAQRQAAIDELIGTGTYGLNQTQKDLLATIQGNRNWELPIEFLTLNRSQSEWVQLRDVLSHERIAQQHNESPDPQAQQFLQAARGHLTVSTAAENLNTNLVAVEAQWSEAVNAQTE